MVILIHGMGEHSSRYIHTLIPKFINADLALISYDQFGHGKSSGKRGHCPSYKSLLECIELISHKAKEIFGKLPVFLYGHSMGGNLIINYILKTKHDFKGAISTSPFLKLAFEPPLWKLNIAKVLYKFYPSITLSSGLDPKGLSRDPKEVNKYIKDPLVHDKISPNYSITMIRSGRWAIENAHLTNLPLLVLHGTKDPITSHIASKNLARRSKNIDLKLYQGALHELHHDLCKNQMLDDVLSWINNLLKPTQAL